MGKTVLALVASTACLAQRTISGGITDSNGEAIPGATVTLTAPNFTATGSTDSRGHFRLVRPPEGAYTITIEAEGFAKFTGSIGASFLDDYYFAAILGPVPADDVEIVVSSTSDAASGRPQYLPGSGLWPGALIDLTGVFRVTDTVQATEVPLPRELNGLAVTFANSDNSYRAPIASAGPNQIQAIVPEELTPGTWSVAVGKGDQPSRPIRVAVLDSGVDPAHGSTFTRNGLGFGTADATNEAGEPITFTNPARPGSVANVKIVTPKGANEFHGNFFFLGRVPASLQLDSAAPGVSTIQLTIPAGFTPSQMSCATPFQIGATTGSGQTRFGNQVTLPVSISGPCTDALGFGPADFPQLDGGGIKIIESLISEGTLLTTNRTDRILGRLSATNWTSSSYAGVSPVDTCAYRWEKFGFRNPNAPASPPLTGNASTTLPWGQFNFSPTSNAGPYGLVFANPASFSEGNYSVNFPAGFTVGGVAHTFQATAEYRRPAGRMRDFVAARAAVQGFWRGQSLGGVLDRVIQSVIDAPPADKASVLADVNILADHGSLGRHVVRCVADPATLTPGSIGGIPTNSLFTQHIPERTNNTTVTVRFFPRETIRHNHANSGADRTHVTFDAFITFQDVNGNR